MGAIAEVVMWQRVLRVCAILVAAAFVVYVGAYAIMTRGIAPHSSIETNRGQRVVFVFFPRQRMVEFMGSGVRTSPEGEEWCFRLFYPLILCDEALGGWVHEWRVDWNFRDESRPAARIG